MSEILKTKATCCHGNSYQLILIYDMTYNYAGYETGVRRMTPTHVRMPGYIVSLISDPECHELTQFHVRLAKTQVSLGIHRVRSMYK